jgi:hypothetical protein
MMYPYMTFADGTEVCHSQILEDGSVEVHFEKPISMGFQTARCRLPGYEWLIRDGYSDAELETLTEFLKCNAHLFFKFAGRGGISCA